MNVVHQNIACTQWVESVYVCEGDKEKIETIVLTLCHSVIRVMGRSGASNCNALVVVAFFFYCNAIDCVHWLKSNSHDFVCKVNNQFCTDIYLIHDAHCTCYLYHSLIFWLLHSVSPIPSMGFWSILFMHQWISIHRTNLMDKMSVPLKMK